MPKIIEFTEEQEVVGYVTTDTGGILIADSVVESDIAIPSKNVVSLDLQMDKRRIPIVATRQGDQRFLLIPLEQAVPITSPQKETVDTEDPVEIPGKTKDTDDGQKEE